jgi:hypothetical protein
MQLESSVSISQTPTFGIILGQMNLVHMHSPVYLRPILLRFVIFQSETLSPNRFFTFKFPF